ncbi:MAG: thiosulfohydrolase SoxB [Proteobacteria bacterium]|nr:thiosulfohydrolase SoxB [Pseudomonadota bacterium]
MLTRRQFLPVAAAALAVAGRDSVGSRALAQGRLGLEGLLRFKPTGQLTLLHMTDCHAQLEPLYLREPSVNIGVGALRDVPPHLTGSDAVKAYGLSPDSYEAYVLTSQNFDALANTYGRVGGMDRLATLIQAIRAERGADRCLLLDGGDALQGSYTSLVSKGGDMVRILQALGVEATTGHWEFTLGAGRVLELFGNRDQPGSSKIAFLASNVRDSDFEEPVFQGWKLFERGGLRVAVIGQAFPYTPVAHPKWMMPRWWFGIREAALARLVADVRRSGADLVVLLSHNGFDVDYKLAGRIEGIDVILSGHTHDALPRPVRVGRTLVVASGSHGKFLSRLDVEMRRGEIIDWSYALIPVLADAIPPAPAVTQLVDQIRAPHAAMLSTPLAMAEGTLWRRGNLGGPLDDVICQALLAERDAEIALSPGFRWGGSVLAGHQITWDDVFNATAMTYPAAYRTSMRGAFLRSLLEDVADNLFNPDPYYQQGGDMVRVAGLSFVLMPDAPAGQRVGELSLTRTGEPIDPMRSYVVAGWGSVNEGIAGPPVWELVGNHLRAAKSIPAGARNPVLIKRG